MTDAVKVEAVVDARIESGDFLLQLGCTDGKAYPMRFTENGAQATIVRLQQLLPNQAIVAKAYSPVGIRTAMTEDGQKSIVFDLEGVGALAIVLPNDGLQFLLKEVSNLLAPPH
jgi:hypothetical protein